MAIPKVYRKTGERVIASYNSENLIENTASLIFYGAVDESGNYILTGNQIYSNVIETSGTPGVNKTFTGPVFNIPKSIKGTAMINFCTRQTSTTDSNINLILSKVSGTNTVELMNVSGANMHSTAGPAALQIFTHCFTGVIPTTHCKAGDYLKLNVFGSAGGGPIYFGHDPMDRDATGLVPSVDEITTKLKAYIPFNIKDNI
jgi:hypothetical protein